MIINIYTDGFNLYYRALQNTPFQWLDRRKWAETLFPRTLFNKSAFQLFLMHALAAPVNHSDSKCT